MLADIAAVFAFGLADLGCLTFAQILWWWEQALRVRPELARGLNLAGT